MPIYEYLCADCGSQFEELIFGNEKARCPDCASERAQKKISVFASPNGSREAALAPGPCGTCGDVRGPGACQLDG
jgi:putative FmdB family regulatory protein